VVEATLLSLPGIFFRRVMDRVKDLQELVTLSEKQLEDILGNDANAALLWSFLHTDLKDTAKKHDSKHKTRVR